MSEFVVMAPATAMEVPCCGIALSSIAEAGRDGQGGDALLRAASSVVVKGAKCFA